MSPFFGLICSMTDAPDSPLLANYRRLIERIDTLCMGIIEAFAATVNCRPGCSACCRHLSLFPVEAAALAAGLHRLRNAGVDITSASRTQERCPLLREDRCLAYGDRPIICRTHGLPILTRENDEPRIDYCPENFQGITSLPGSGVIDLEAVNKLLVAINAQFVQESPGSSFSGRQRFSIADIIDEVCSKNDLATEERT